MIGKQNAEESSMTDNITQELANLFLTSLCLADGIHS